MANLRASAEDYLETILLLSQKQALVHAIDIGESMGFSRPSVSVALKKLRAEELVRVDGKGAVFLTEKGRAVAGQVYERHSVLFEWLCSCGVQPHIAATDACRMEHLLSEESFTAIKNFIKNPKNY